MYLYIAIYILLTVSGLVLFKLGAAAAATDLTIASGSLSFRISTLSLVGVLCYGCSFLLYLSLLSKYELGYIYPLSTGVVYILVLLSSVLIFKEHLSWTGIVGAILILIGVVLINWKSRG